MFPRSAGLLLPVASLPSGGLSDDAFRFVDFCQAAGQRWWQVLPLTPPGYGGSPYAGLSAFAGDEALLDGDATGDLRALRRNERFWLDDYTLFRALRDRYSGRAWTDWPAPLRDRDAEALAAARDELAEPVARYERAQAEFDRQWARLRAYARERGVGLVGDLPLFVAHDSADVWAHRELFKLDARGKPSVVAGVPPDYFSRDGQRWGNPHYDWTVHRRRRFRWWTERLARAGRLYDAVRLDHFLGLVRGYEVPARARTARRGKWVRGPGAALFEAVEDRIDLPPLIAEDLGLLTPEAAELRDRLALPGMRVLQFSFGDDPGARPYAFPVRSVVYTGTHDNNTVVGWLREGGADRRCALRYAGGGGVRDAHWRLIRVAHQTASELAVVPVQDVLGLGARARTNRPGTTRGNWRWKLRRGQLRPAHARRLLEITRDAGR